MKGNAWVRDDGRLRQIVGLRKDTGLYCTEGQGCGRKQGRSEGIKPDQTVVV